ncbi:DUF3572 domain-containing protein [Croceibacterium soli]|uniref:DUF3572 domain-containing protein n=1 Tax=Croceibacterium soli TaxID=1739690 RepID=UPI00192817E3|nr:DUF3572 domain-containing protein [Croceibacterium soli]
MTILTGNQFEAPDAAGLSLSALAWVLADERRAHRFLDLTGLTPEQMRARIESPELQLSVLEFLCAHEPDLLAAAESLGVQPGAIAAAREKLAR